MQGLKAWSAEVWQGDTLCGRVREGTAARLEPGVRRGGAALGIDGDDAIVAGRIKVAKLEAEAPQIARDHHLEVGGERARRRSRARQRSGAHELCLSRGAQQLIGPKLR